VTENFKNFWFSGVKAVVMIGPSPTPHGRGNRRNQSGNTWRKCRPVSLLAKSICFGWLWATTTVFLLELWVCDSNQMYIYAVLQLCSLLDAWNSVDMNEVLFSSWKILVFFTIITLLFVFNNYSLCPFLIIAVGVRAISLTWFVENTCNICISK